MTSSLINQICTSLFARGMLDGSDVNVQFSGAPMQTLSQGDLRHVSGGDDATINGSPKGSWSASSSTGA